MSTTSTVGVATKDAEASVSGQRARSINGSDGSGRPDPVDSSPSDNATSAESPRTIDEIRLEIDQIDAELVRLIQRRTELSRTIGALRTAHGGTRIVYSREMKILDRFNELGPAGTDLGMLLLSMGRGKLGRR